MTEKQIKLEMDNNIAEGKYSNLAIISHSESEFIFDFAFNSPQKARVISRIVTNPAHAKRLLKALANNVKQYEDKFGPIKETQDPPKPQIGFSNN